MFRKFTDTLSGTLDAVKTYGTSIGSVIGVQGDEAQEKDRKTRPSPAATPAAKPATEDVEKSSPSDLPEETFRAPAKKPNNFFGFSQPPPPSNPIINQTSHLSAPALGRGLATGESPIKHMEEMGMRQPVVNSVKVADENRRGMDGMPKLIRSNTDDLIDKEFEEAKCKLDDVLDVPMDSDTELRPGGKKDGKDAGKETKKKKKPMISEDSCLGRLKACIQDDHVRRKKVDPDDLLDKPDKNVLLKRILNILFLLCGILLFVAVVVVIIYTATVKPSAEEEEDENVVTEDPGLYTTTEFSYLE